MPQAKMTNLTTDQKERIYHWHSRGCDTWQIAEITGVSEETVYRVIYRKFGSFKKKTNNEDKSKVSESA